MKKLKLASIALAGLVLASCINEKNSGDETTSFTASPTVGGVDLRTLRGWPRRDSATLSGFGVTLSNNGTVAKFTYPDGAVSFTGTKTCNNSAGGCDVDYVVTGYNQGGSGWDSQAIPNYNVFDQTSFTYNNLGVGGGNYQTGFFCIPKA